MARPDRSADRRAEWIPILARTFAELGYRRASTAALAERCGVAENALYRLWPDKRAMFIAALDHVGEVSTATWEALARELGPGQSAARRMLDYEASHHGEFGLYRIVFAGLSETDDPEIAAALRRLYRRFQRFVQRQVESHREAHPTDTPSAQLAAWALVGLGTVANVGRELGVLSARARRELFTQAGNVLIGTGPKRKTRR